MTDVFLFRENPWKPRPKSAEFDIDIGNIDHSLTRVVTKVGKITNHLEATMRPFLTNFEQAITRKKTKNQSIDYFNFLNNKNVKT